MKNALKEELDRMRELAGIKLHLSESKFSSIYDLTKDEFLGKPAITTNANAKFLKPSELTTLKEIEPEPFLKGKYKAKFNEDGAVVFDEDKIIASYHFGDTLVVDKKYRGLGIAKELVYQWRKRYPDVARASSRTRASQAIQKSVWDRIQDEKDRQEFEKKFGTIEEGSEQSTANTSDGAQKPPMQTQSPSIGSPMAGIKGRVPIAKQPAPSQKYTEEEMEEIIGDENDYPNTDN